MNEMKKKTNSVSTDDVFRAAYLLRYGEFKKAKVVDGEVRYTIEGDWIAKEDYEYRSGGALVNPLVLGEAVRLLKDLTIEAGIKIGREFADIDSEDLDEEPILLKPIADEEPTIEIEEMNEDLDLDTEQL